MVPDEIRKAVKGRSRRIVTMEALCVPWRHDDDVCYLSHFRGFPLCSNFTYHILTLDVYFQEYLHYCSYNASNGSQIVFILREVKVSNRERKMNEIVCASRKVRHQVKPFFFLFVVCNPC